MEGRATCLQTGQVLKPSGSGLASPRSAAEALRLLPSARTCCGGAGPCGSLPGDCCGVEGGELCSFAGPVAGEAPSLPHISASISVSKSIKSSSSSSCKHQSLTMTTSKVRDMLHAQPFQRGIDLIDTFGHQLLFRHVWSCARGRPAKGN